MIDKDLIVEGNFGIEKENLRVDKDGKLALTRHPNVFGRKNQYITTDFSESQIEMITPPCNSIDDAMDFLLNLHTIISNEIGDEYLWPQSNPPILPEEQEIPLAVYEDGSKQEYREYLSLKYGNKRSVLSGIHFNFSFSKALLEAWHTQASSVADFREFSDALYLKVTKYFMKYRWFFIYLFGASPVFHETYIEGCVRKSKRNEFGDCFVDGMRSLRNSSCGYRNKELYYIDYSSQEAYNQSVDHLVKNKKIIQPSELYHPVRLKQNDDKTHIDYLEMRFLDLNPFYTVGVNKEDLQLIHLFAIFFAQKEDFDYNNTLQEYAQFNHDHAALFTDSLLVKNNQGKLIVSDQEVFPILDEMETYFDSLSFVTYNYKKIIEKTRICILQPNMTYAHRIQEAVDKGNYIKFHMEQAKEYLVQTRNKSYQLYGFENMELSTQLMLQAAMKYGLNFEVLDRSANFIRLSDLQGLQIEYIKEATKTSLDKYSQILVMENKHVTKIVLEENHIVTPKGYMIQGVEEAIYLLKHNRLRENLVVKPNNSNFGKGITIFKYGYTKDALSKAIQVAQKEDSDVLLEPFVNGKEYRFLVIEDEVVGVLHRRAASVVGDGILSIQELVDKKNQSNLRGQGYKTPLEYLELGEVELQYLKEQKLTSQDIPEKGLRVYLRENSNISTGGDSIDFTDEVHSTYKEIAIKATRAVDVKICGIDIIIEDIYKPLNECNYSIIELNFNPAIHIHSFPYRGENRRAADKVIHALFYKNKEILR